MWMLLFFVAVIAAIGALWARFVRRMRGAGWAAAACFVFAFICLVQIGSGLNEEAMRAGFADVGEQNRAKQAGITDPKEWAGKRDDILRAETTGAPLDEAQARQFATTALTSTNASCARDMTIVENPPALPNQHVLTVRCGDAAAGKVYQVREAEAPQAPAPSPLNQEPVRPPVEVAAAESETSEPGECGVTLAAFNKLRSGMSYSQAIRVLGCPGEEMSRVEIPELPTTVMYSEWRRWLGCKHERDVPRWLPDQQGSAGIAVTVMPSTRW